MSLHAIVSYLFAFIAFGITIAVMGIGGLYGTQSLKIFYNTNSILSVKYGNDLIPPGYVFNIIWPIILIWTLSGICYILASVFLPNRNSVLKRTPSLAPIHYLVCYSISFTACLAWFFASDQENLAVSLVLLLLAWGFAWSAIGISLHRLYQSTADLEVNNKVMLWLVRILIQNGLGTLGAWLTLATSLGISFTILYEGSFGQPIATLKDLVSIESGASIMFGVLMGVLIVWFVLDNFVLEKYCRYFFTVYPVFIFGFSGIVSKLRSLSSQRNLVLASVALSLAVIMFLIKICLSVYRIGKSCKGKAQYSSKSPEHIPI